MNRNFIKYGTFLLSLLLIWFLLRQVDVGQLWDSLINIELKYYFIAFLFYFATYLIQAFRVYLLVENVSFGRLTTFILLHKFLNRVLPLRSGEIFFPILLKNLCNIDYSHGISKLFLIRLADLSSVFISMLLTCLFIGFDFGLSEYLIFIGTLAMLLYLMMSLKKVVPFCIGLAKRLLSKKWENKLSAFAEQSAEALTLSRRSMFLLIFTSVVDKFLNYIMAFFIMLGLNYRFGLFEMIVANAASGITEILPINSIGSFGTTELGWAGALMYFGHSQQEAISSGFSFNLIAFSYTFCLGLIGLIPATFIYNLWTSKRPISELGE